MFNEGNLTFADRKFYVHLIILAFISIALIIASFFFKPFIFALCDLLILGLSLYLVISSFYTKYISKYLYLPRLSFIYGFISLIQMFYLLISTYNNESLVFIDIVFKDYYVSRISFAFSTVLITYFFVKLPHKMHQAMLASFVFFGMFFILSFFVPTEAFFAFLHSHTLLALMINLVNHLIMPLALIFLFFYLYPIRHDLPFHYKRILITLFTVCIIKECIDILYFIPLRTPAIISIMYRFISLSILVISQIDICILRPFQTLDSKSQEVEQLISEHSESVNHYTQHVQKLEFVVKNQFTSFQKLISIFPEPCLICIGSTIYQVNPAAIKLFASSNSHGLIGTDLLNYLKDIPTLKADFDNLTKNPGTLLEGEATLVLPNNKTCPVEYVFTSNTLYSTESILCIIRNVSSKYETQSTQQALQRQQVRLRYFSSLSHDIKTPINIIYSALQMQSRSATLAECTHYTEMMHTSCLKLLKLLNNLLDLTKIDNQMLLIKPQHFNIVDAIETLCAVASHYISSKGLTYIFDTELDEQFVYMDPLIIERIILNLLSNAIKYTPTGGELFINLTFTDTQTSIHIKDSGPGIPKEKLAVIFNRYTTLDSQCNIEYSSGLGLSIVSDLLYAIGGTISCKSELEVGSEFIITLETPPLDVDVPLDPYHLSSTAQNIKIEFCDI